MKWTESELGRPPPPPQRNVCPDCTALWNSIPHTFYLSTFLQPVTGYNYHKTDKKSLYRSKQVSRSITYGSQKAYEAIFSLQPLMAEWIWYLKKRPAGSSADNSPFPSRLYEIRAWHYLSMRQEVHRPSSVPLGQLQEHGYCELIKMAVLSKGMSLRIMPSCWRFLHL